MLCCQFTSFVSFLSFVFVSLIEGKLVANLKFYCLQYTSKIKLPFINLFKMNYQNVILFLHTLHLALIQTLNLVEQYYSTSNFLTQITRLIKILRGWKNEEGWHTLLASAMSTIPPLDSGEGPQLLPFLTPCRHRMLFQLSQWL